MTFDQAIIVLREYQEGRREYDWVTWIAFLTAQPALAKRTLQGETK